MAIIGLSLASCKKTDKDELGCKIPFKVGNQVTFKEVQKPAKPGWNPVTLYKMPLTIKKVDAFCDDPFYIGKDADSLKVQFYHSSVKLHHL